MKFEEMPKFVATKSNATKERGEGGNSRLHNNHAISLSINSEAATCCKFLFRRMRVLNFKSVNGGSALGSHLALANLGDWATHFASG